MSRCCFIAAEMVSVCVYATIVLMFHTFGMLLGGIWRLYKWIGGKR